MKGEEVPPEQEMRTTCTGPKPLGRAIPGATEVSRQWAVSPDRVYRANDELSTTARRRGQRIECDRLIRRTRGMDRQQKGRRAKLGLHDVAAVPGALARPEEHVRDPTFPEKALALLGRHRAVEEQRVDLIELREAPG